MLSISGSALWRHHAEAVEVFGEADAAQGPGERPLPRETLEDLRTGRPSSAVEEFGEEVALRLHELLQGAQPVTTWPSPRALKRRSDLEVADPFRFAHEAQGARGALPVEEHCVVHGVAKPFWISHGAVTKAL
jgi:hypothetical protein